MYILSLNLLACYSQSLIYLACFYSTTYCLHFVYNDSCVIDASEIIPNASTLLLNYRESLALEHLDRIELLRLDYFESLPLNEKEDFLCLTGGPRILPKHDLIEL